MIDEFPQGVNVQEHLHVTAAIPMKTREDVTMQDANQTAVKTRGRDRVHVVHGGGHLTVAGIPDRGRDLLLKVTNERESGPDIETALVAIAAAPIVMVN